MSDASPRIGRAFLSAIHCLLLTFVCGFAFGADFSAPLQFINFSGNVALQGNGDSYQLVPGEISVDIAPRVLIKTTTQVNQEAVVSFIPAVHKVVMLYRGFDFRYFLLHLKANSDLHAAMMSLQKHPEILLVQPDILQTSVRAAADESTKAEFLTGLHIPELWQSSKGEGIKIAIIDDGFDLSHAEFAATKVAFAYDVENQQLSAAPRSRLDFHGTQVAGIIFANHDTSHLSGIAPNAQLIAIRQPDSWTSNTLLSFQVAALAGADIINCSWTNRQLLQPVADVVEDLARHGRGGLGTVVVFAAGNQGRLIDNSTTEAAIADAVVVGALTLDNRRLASSNFGPSVDLEIYGAGTISTAANNRYSHFSGTSLASSITSGMAALVLSENPQLTPTQVVAVLQKNTVLQKQARSAEPHLPNLVQSNSHDQ